MAVHKGYHFAYEVHYHLVFPVKYRKALISKRIKGELMRSSHKIQERFDLEIEQMGADHLFYSGFLVQKEGENYRPSHTMYA